MSNLGYVRILRACRFAEAKHAKQTYHGGPYMDHLQAVFETLDIFGWGRDMELMTAALLHDVLEDTETTLPELTEEFGEYISNLVYNVTDQPGKNRRERHGRTYPFIRGKARPTALKLADRIANVTNCLRYKAEPKEAGLLQMYRKEHPEFEGVLRDRDQEQNEAMWLHLNDLLQQGEEKAKP